MLDLGTVRPGSTIRIPFSTFDKDDGSAITMTNFAAADILIYKDGSTTERASTSGFTATTDFDSKTGKHVAVIDLADNTTSGFYNAGSEYLVAIDSVTVDSVTVGGWIARFRIGYPNAVFDTTIATLSSQTSFTLTAGPAEDDALNGHCVIIHDIASSVQMSKALVLDYTGSTKTVTLAAGTTFTAAAGDNISIMDLAPLQPTTTGRTLDVSTGGEAGVDWANVGSPTTSLALTGTTIATTQKVDVETIKTNPVVNAGTITFPTGATLASTTNITAGTITTVTTVTNQLTAAQIATGVWQDTTAGDFTVASSIGKALYINNVAPGGSGGLLISGSNSGTTTFGALTVTGATTLTGNVVLSDGLTISAPSTLNRAGITITGNGSGAGIISTGGSTGNGVSFVGGASGHGFACTGTGTTKHGIIATGGATTSAGINAVGGGTSGDGILITATSGHGISTTGGGTTKHGIHAAGGATTSHGINAIGGGVGHGILATSGSGATGDGIRATAASTNGNGFNLVGVGTGAGILATGGTTGHGISGVGGATSGNGMRLAGTAGNSIAFNILGQGSAAGMSVSGGATGAGAAFIGGATSGSSITQSVTSGNAYIAANVTHAAGTAWASGAITSSAFAAGAINAAAIATDAIDADALAADAIAEINATVDTALADINLDHLVKNAVDTNFATTVHLDSVVGYLADAGTTATFDRTTDSLEVLGAATAPSAATIADAVWDEALSGHLSAGSTGEALNAAGSAGDPWTTSLPGAYTGSQAGKMLSDILTDTGTTLQAELDGIQADTEDIQTRLPAALVGGRIDATVDATGMESGAVGAIVAGVWDTDATTYQNQGTFGQVLGDTGGAGNSIYTTVSSNLPVDLSSVPADTAAAVWQDLTANHTDAGTYGLALGTALQTNLETVDTVVDSIKVKTDYLPSATAGATGGLFIAGSNAATTVNITGNLSGSVGSVTGAVGSVTATVSADVVSISGDSTAADNLESYLDGTNFMPVDAHKPIFSISGATLTVKKPDGTTTAYTRTLTTDAAADPVTGSS